MTNRVLIIDDSEDDVVMLERFLTDGDTSIMGLTDSSQAEQAFAEFKPDLVLLDLHMPPPDGLEILRRLRDSRGVLNLVPVVVLTGDVGPTARNTALDLGAVDYLTKPLDRQAVVVRVRNLLATRRLYTALVRSSQNKSNFLMNMSHEMRTPLSAIIGFSELMADDKLGRFDDATRHKFLEEINSSGRFLLALLDDILDLSKIEAGKMVLRIESLSIADIVIDVVTSMEPLATRKTIRLEADVATAGRAPADALKLKSMLLNLVSNAIKFTPIGGRVAIETRRLDDFVELSVSDTGIGISAADREHLFEEFRQFDSAISRQNHGTGLGLALTKRFVELHGGEIHLESEVGKGSTFTLRLPLVPRGDGPSVSRPGARNGVRAGGVDRQLKAPRPPRSDIL
ncbi:MAG TPA: hybrid sensor histidine kinase/response regulator [Candidatus Dormibacteraeota bacterium]|nr:hybrid sensor histidine kinase/response regulator [Candidatus Dormibacteraeota bacterium]